MKLEVRL